MYLIQLLLTVINAIDSSFELTFLLTNLLCIPIQQINGMNLVIVQIGMYSIS